MNEVSFFWIVLSILLSAQESFLGLFLFIRTSQVRKPVILAHNQSGFTGLSAPGCAREIRCAMRLECDSLWEECHHSRMISRMVHPLTDVLRESN